MATTHVFVGLALVVPAALAVPEFATPLAVGAILGGVAPDLDIVFDHRRTLHFPVTAGVLAVPAVGVALVVPSVLSVAGAAFLVATWIHALSDAAGGGPDFDPWTNPTEKGVYDHVNGRWIRPRRWIRYDGAPEDAVLAVALAVPALVVFDGWIQTVVVAGVVISLGYALIRRRMVEWADVLE